jgi:hypothetical protein
MSKKGTLSLWGKGIVQTKSGHLRFTSPGQLRGQYVHRRVVDQLVEDTHPLTRQLLPWPYEVHHMDFVKTNNAPHNLLLLPECFHSTTTSAGQRREGGRFVGFRPKWRPKSQYELFDEGSLTPFEEVDF